MPFARPSIQELIERTQADLESRLPGVDAHLRRSVVAALARMNAGQAHGLHGHLAWEARQIIYDTADAEILARWASVWGVPRLAATYASGPVSFSGTNGTVIPAATQVETGDGRAYTTDVDVTISGGSAQVDVTAVEPGAAGNQSGGVTLSLVSPIAGVDSQATVAAGGLTGGADTESDDSLRQRLLQRIQNPPQGGAKNDYITWALSAHPDVTRAWVYPNALGLGTVTVRVMTDGPTANGIPTQTVIDAVDAYIQGKRPVTADVSVVAPVAAPLAIHIANLRPDTQAVRDAIAASIADMIRRDAEPGGTIEISHIRAAISVAAGETDHTLVSPIADVTHAANEIAVPGALTWS